MFQKKNHLGSISNNGNYVEKKYEYTKRTVVTGVYRVSNEKKLAIQSKEFQRNEALQNENKKLKMQVTW